MVRIEDKIMSIEAANVETANVLTPAQARILAKVRAKGEAKYNGLAKRPIERLVALGLVTADFDLLLLGMKGSGFWCITVRPA